MLINVINTGGTISCTGNPLAPMSAQAFAAACESILDPIISQRFPDLQLAYVTDLVFPESQSGTLDSTNLQPTDWCLIAEYILQHYAECDGWIVLHGTDTMDFTGTALPFLLSSFSAQGVGTAVLSKPVILTGSQVPMFYQSSAGAPLALNYNTDAFQNFCGAAAAAQTGIPEICIYFDAQLFRGNRGVKTDANHFDAFSSPNFPALGVNGIELELNNALILPPPVSPAVSLDDPGVRQRALAQLDYVKTRINDFAVMPFNAFPAWYRSGSAGAPGTALIASLLRACTAQGIKGLVLESYGEGNFPSGNPDQPSAGAIYQALDEANAQGVVIVDCTQVLRGVVNDGAYAAGSWLPAVGALCPFDMTPMAALAKLTVLLSCAGFAGNGWSLAQVKRLLQLNLLGEMQDVSRLDSRVNPVLRPGQSLTALDGSATLVNDPVLGPQLTTSTGELLWSAASALPPAQMPGRLVVGNDGSLVLQGRNGTPLWSAPCGGVGGHPSMLVLYGSTADASLSLSVVDYVAGATTCTLFSQGNAPAAHATPAAAAAAGTPSTTPAKTRMTTALHPHFKLSGMVSPEDPLHQVTQPMLLGAAPDEHYIAPTTVYVNIVVPPGTGTIGVPKYAPTVSGGVAAGYDPARDCAGNFMSYKFQPNNNCYAYGCNITTNTFPQPGRNSGYRLTADNFKLPFDELGQLVATYAEKDGLVFVGRSMAELMQFKSARQGTNPGTGGALQAGHLGGHFVALMISPAGDAQWPGDYHWARCDNSAGACDSWSQKDGGDQVTNFDFAGNPIRDPATANWSVNQGPVTQDKQELVVEYGFYCFMFVPEGGVNIL